MITFGVILFVLGALGTFTDFQLFVHGKNGSILFFISFLAVLAGLIMVIFGW